MSIVRLSLLFHHVTGSTALVNGAPVRTAGWSESFYYESSVAGPATLNQLQVRRAALLPAQAAIIGQRFQFDDGSTRTSTERFAGTTGESVDIPQMGVLCASRNLGAQSTRHFILRGIPDTWVVAGELVTTATILLPFTQFFNQLPNGFKWKARDKAALQANITSIDAAGNYLTADEFPTAAGRQVRMVRVVNTIGESITGKYRIESIAGTRAGKIANWTGNGTVGAVGKLQAVSFIYPAFLAGQTFISRVTPKKVGRSFFQSRGRASARRR